MLTLTYIVLAAAGCGVVALTVALGSVFDGHGLFDHHGGVDTGFHFPFLSPTALAALAGAVGAFGLIALYGFQVSEPTSLKIALPAGFVFSYAATYVAWRLLQGSTGTTTVRPEDLVGVTAEIITPIPAGGIGEAAAMVRGERFAASAREVDGLATERGAVVTVVRYAGATLYVRAQTAGAGQPASPLDS
jgi:membrane protein implicated in regulation of membrane protease activity